jgi:tRNA dimethylallyltransferase
MYMTVMLDGIFEKVSRDPQLREKLQKEAILKGMSTLHRRLAEMDPVVAAKIHHNDANRIIRALEVCMTAGVAMSQMQTQREGLWGTRPIKIFALTRSRDELYRRVEARVEDMFNKGLVDEVKSILEMNLSSTAKTLIGIPEVSGLLEGLHDIEQAKYLMKINTRHFVKRQLTWLRRDKRVEWIEMGNQTADEVAKGIVYKIESV